MCINKAMLENSGVMKWAMYRQNFRIKVSLSKAMKISELQSWLSQYNWLKIWSIEWAIYIIIYHFKYYTCILGVAKKKNILTFETLPFPEFLFRKLENSEFIINVSEVMWEKIDPLGTKSMSHAIFSVIVSKIKKSEQGYAIWSYSTLQYGLWFKFWLCQSDTL